MLTQIINALHNQFLAGGLGLMAVGSIGVLLRRIPAQLWNLLLRHGTVVIDIESTDVAYNWILYWLDGHPYGKTSRRTTLKHIRLKNGEYHSILVPSRGHHWFLYNHRPLWLSRNKESTPAGGNSDLQALLDPKELITIRMLGRSRDTIYKLVQSAKTLYESTDKDMLKIHTPVYGGWNMTRRPRRKMESILLPDSAVGLLEDMQQFMNNQRWYRNMGIPYRRGYLFHGPPGTGKSSTADAIAGELEIPIYILNLAMMTDQTLQQAISNMSYDAMAMLLIEDIDTVCIKRDAKPNEQKLSLGTVLNVLDGVQAGDSIILVMTSNNPEAIDPALVRKGRIDKIVEFGMASESQINQAVKRFLPNTTIEQCRQIAAWPRPISMAEVQEHLKLMALSQETL